MYLKCQVCGTVTLVRLQIGWLDRHPIHIPCGSCRISLEGTVSLDQEKPDFHVEFANAEQVQETDIEFYAEASSELLTKKLRAFPEKRFTYAPPPFFTALWDIGQENYPEFQGRARGFLLSYRENWPVVKRINQLWLAGQLHLLDGQARQFLSERQFPMDSEVEKLRAVHNVTLKFLYPIIPDNFWSHDAPKLIDTFAECGSTEPKLKRFRRLLLSLEKQGSLPRYESSVFGLLSRFLESYERLIVGFSMTYIPGNHATIYEDRSATAVTLEDVKQLYQDAFEVIGDILPAIIGANNLLVRSHAQDMAPRRKDIRNLQDYAALQKADRFAYFDGEGPFDFVVVNIFDNLVRNSIAHNSYEYDPVTQLITFGELGSNRTVAMYLVEFIEKVWRILAAVLNMGEVVYQLRKYHRVIIKGERVVSPSVFFED